MQPTHSSSTSHYPVFTDLFQGRDVKPLFRLHRLLERLPEATPFRPLLERRYEKEFAENRSANLFRGIFSSFAEAQASIPVKRSAGYNNSTAASLYLDRAQRVFPSDYPVMFWLDKLIAPSRCRILDLGGHVGVSYYAYRNYLDYPEQLRWIVHDVPAVMERGKKIAKEKDNAKQLGFCDRFEDCGSPDILFSIGTLQYLPDTLPERLATLERLPQHLLLSLLPIHMSESFYTLQSIGPSYCPYRIFARDGFIQGFESLGYSLVDWWECPEKNCIIPFHPRRSLDRYFGFLFSLVP
ncbi:MAG TPA: TIGR04325 family methyltransferase [Burkholderiaceae bacterium]|nr:TIGR04325 family methyltransferase [Burkholderiaceae bacterium]